MSAPVFHLLRARLQLRQATQQLDAMLDEIALPKPYPTETLRSNASEALACTISGALEDIHLADGKQSPKDGAS